MNYIKKENCINKYDLINLTFIDLLLNNKKLGNKKII